MNKQIEKDLKQKVERLKAFEEKFEILVENISIKIEDSETFNIFCEVFPKNGTSIQYPINIEYVIYDNEGSILDKTESYIDNEYFFGFEVIDACFYFQDGIPNNIGKIRIYPKKG